MRQWTRCPIVAGRLVKVVGHKLHDLILVTSTLKIQDIEWLLKSNKPVDVMRIKLSTSLKLPLLQVIAVLYPLNFAFMPRGS